MRLGAAESFDILAGWISLNIQGLGMTVPKAKRFSNSRVKHPPMNCSLPSSDLAASEIDQSNVGSLGHAKLSVGFKVLRFLGIRIGG